MRSQQETKAANCPPCAARTHAHTRPGYKRATRTHTITLGHAAETPVETARSTHGPVHSHTPLVRSGSAHGRACLLLHTHPHTHTRKPHQPRPRLCRQHTHLLGKPASCREGVLNRGEPPGAALSVSAPDLLPELQEKVDVPSEKVGPPGAWGRATGCRPARPPVGWGTLGKPPPLPLGELVSPTVPQSREPGRSLPPSVQHPSPGPRSPLAFLASQTHRQAPRAEHSLGTPGPCKDSWRLWSGCDFSNLTPGFKSLL